MNGNSKIFPLIGLVLCISVFAASCSVAAPSATPTSPAAPATKTATASPQPSLTPTHPPLNTPLFVHPTFAHSVLEMPTAIDTPQESQTSYHLKPWTEQDSIDLIRQMNQYARDADLPGTGSNRYIFAESQLSVRFAIQDALLRFPDSQHTDDYLWHLAFSRAIHIYDKPGVDEWLIAQIDKALNTSGYSPDSLNDLLNPYGFAADDIRTTPNLFRDGKAAWVFNVKTNEEGAYDGGLFLAIRQQTPAVYQLFKLASQWAFNSGASNIEEVEDQNKNGIPEIVLNIGNHSGTMCDAKVHIYEWDGAAFYDLSNGRFNLFECGSSWTYGPNDQKGIPTIILDNFSPFQLSSKDQYTWNGKFYEFTDYLDATPLQSWSYHSNQFFTTSYPDDVALLPALLDSAETLKQGPAYPDFLRFRLGVAYAMQSKPEQAIQEMRKLISSPRDSSVTIYAALAKEFLEHYQGDADLYRACAETRQLDDDISKQYHSPDGFLDSGAIQKLYGFAPHVADAYGWKFSFPCEHADAFALFVKTLPADAKDIPSVLQKNGVELAYSASFDINADGQIEWLVIDADEYWYLIALQDGIFQAHQVGGGSEQIPETLQVAHWTDIPDPALILRGKESLDIFTINENFETNVALYAWKLKDFRISENLSAPEIQLAYKDALPDVYYPSVPWAGYRWDAASQTFKEDLLEYKLFVKRDPKAAAEIATAALPLFDHWTKQLNIPYWTAPRDYYLAGYAYQLAGDGQKAIQVYWQLWQDHPNSAYALMARARLEPDKP